MLIERAKELNYLKGARVRPNELKFSHLQFADDTIIFCEADKVELVNIKKILRCFELMSSLKINFHKSVVCGVGVNNEEIKDYVSILHCHSQKLSITYLGIPLWGQSKKKEHLEISDQKVKKKLASWKRKLLSLPVWKEDEVLWLYELLWKAPSLSMESEDSCKWAGNSEGSFTVVAAWKWWMFSKSPTVSVTKELWNNVAPPMSLWKARNEYLFSGKSVDWNELSELVKKKVASRLMSSGYASYWLGALAVIAVLGMFVLILLSVEELESFLMSIQFIKASSKV
ncbi:uncharacterized protein LOC114257253 [Camellia sinensis]|uniref:uncharacterized protein LOC114257253 n=1 Tax=Camellia sinensis TaxID=4442 RepID=UPI00103557BB|nr:uncharacterized protein LOC114257253 [Camellia sinensis]